MTGTGYQDEPRPPIRRKARCWYPPHGTKPRRADRVFRCPPTRNRVLREWTTPDSRCGRAYSREARR